MVAGALVGEDARLGAGVVVYIGMPIVMIVRYIEQHGYVRPEVDDVFELEAGHLRHDDPFATVRGLDERHADISRRDGRDARVLEHRLDDADRRGLAVGAGHRDDAALDKARSQLNLAPYGDTPAGRVT